MLTPTLARRAIAEGVGAAFLLIAVVGSGIAAQRLSPDDTGLQLLENALATAAILLVLLLVLGPVSGAHLNPVVTLVDRWFGGVTTAEMVVYWVAQLSGAVVGTIVANLMFDLDAVTISTKDRASAAHGVSEVVATLGLLLVVFGLARLGRARFAPLAVAAYIGGAYFFASSTSFANPAVTVARMLSNTFAGIEPAAAPLFVGAQLVGAAVAVVLIPVLFPARHSIVGEVVVPHDEGGAS